MKRFATAAFFAVALFVFEIAAQAPSPRDQQEQRLLALVKEVQTQQATIAENQKKMEETIADLAEDIRQARIYSSRGH